ncbi:MAG: DegT/DnrJ/EryC1/StrS family aminotransferase [Acidobacteria bacterium]|nr:DegT/DnrJ/EryC1/StrS family aminotransferase [Acidobacteriota bacterium]
MQVPFVDLKTQCRALKGEVLQAIEGVLDRADFILGEEVSLLEEEFASYCGVRYAVGLDSGISALELGLRALGIQAGDEVITVANTFIATASSISFAGARPVLVDVDPRTYNMDPPAVEAAITHRTRAVVPVHLYGQPADMDPILSIAEKHRLVVLEDACQAHGAHYKGRRVGSLGHAAAFSFYPGKNLGAFGDGGMLVTNSAEVADKVRMLRNYGQSRKYVHDFLAFNHRLDTVQAAVLRIKLRHLDEWNRNRRKRAALYDQLLKDVEVVTPFASPLAEHVYHLYVIRTRRRDEMQAWLQSRAISTGMHYPIPIHLQNAYRDLNYPAGKFPVTEKSAGEILSLPMYPEMGENQVSFVAQAVSDFFSAR